MVTSLFKQIRYEFYRHRAFYLILLLLTLAMGLMLHAGKQGADARRYLVWAHSFVFDQDTHLLNDFEVLGREYRLTPTGHIFEVANIGAPLMWIPFYGAASFFLPPLLPTAGNSYPADATIQLLWLNFSSWCYTILAGIFTIGSLGRLFTRRVILVTVTGILVGTPVLFYMATFSLSPHPVSIFLASLLLYLWMSRSPKRFIFRYLALGIVIGWMMLIANYNIVFFLLPGLDLLKDLVTYRKTWPILQGGIAVAVGGVLGFGPQMIIWWFMFNNPFYSPYYGQLFWREPHILETLFSTFHGLLFYAPVLILVGFGLWWLRLKDGWIGLSIGLTWLLLTYIVSTNVTWWAGSSFGNRYFLTLSPFFAVGLAAFIQKSKKWGLVLTVLCISWTLGLYLQFLDGVRLTSDSVVYQAGDLAQGQLIALAHIGTILPQLWANIPWSLVSGATLPLFILILTLTSRLLYGWIVMGEHKAISPKVQVVIVGVSTSMVLFIMLAGLRGEQTKAVLVSQGFYQQPHEVVNHEVKEVAGEAGLVTRAMYYQQTGQPDKAIADLKLASRLWNSDTAPYPTRSYLGPISNQPLEIPVHLHLDYPGNVRLIGYHILEADQKFIQGELFWEKQAGEKSGDVVTPIIRAFDRFAHNLGNVELESPFPAEYIPAGSLFKDTFTLHLAAPADSWIWLAVNLAEDSNASPINAQGRPESGIIGSVNVGTVAALPLNSSEDVQDFIGQTELLVGPTYQPGQTIAIQWMGQVQPRGSTAAGLVLTLLDSGGKIAARQAYPLPLPPEAANLPASVTYCFDLPATLAAEDYRLTFALEPPGAASRLIEAGPLTVRRATVQPDFVSTICDLLEADFVRRYEAPAPQNSVGASVAKGQIKLLGYDLSIIPQGNSVSARVMLHWQAQTAVTQDYRVAVQLLDAGGQPIITHTDVPVHGSRPTSSWLQGELILDEHLLAVPALAPGIYHLSLALLAGQPGQLIEGLDQTDIILQDIPIP